jgi:hypothetical protein
MWLSQILWKLCGFATAYLKNFREGGFNLPHAVGMTKSQLGRFYWVNLIFCAFVLYYLFSSTQWLREADTLENPQCYPAHSLPIIALFILAEIASFTLFVGANIEAWILYRRGDAQNHAILLDIPSRQAAARRLHRLFWTWFPFVLAASVYFSTCRFDEVTDWCIHTTDANYSGAMHSARLVLAIVWPGLIVSFVVVAGLNWAFYRWKPNKNLATTLVFSFTLYVLAIAVAGPSDALGLVNLCRKLPGNLDWIFKSLVGG